MHYSRRSLASSLYNLNSPYQACCLIWFFCYSSLASFFEHNSRSPVTLFHFQWFQPSPRPHSPAPATTANTAARLARYPEPGDSGATPTFLCTLSPALSLLTLTQPALLLSFSSAYAGCILCSFYKRLLSNPRHWYVLQTQSLKQKTRFWPSWSYGSSEGNNKQVNSNKKWIYVFAFSKMYYERQWAGCFDKEQVEKVILFIF